ncbi:hypothetical protein HID58_024546 [Brassica napus]|uniref:Uncharacterized protein n=1 Tax=Brassica napus TaxID=3708 RepID=A0ABQ7XG97_BRANA|nr:hypothetical protein HID58_024546 [Brassica napus]
MIFFIILSFVYSVESGDALETGLKILSKNRKPKESIQIEDKDITYRRTLRLVSDAILIFSAPRTQWAQVLRRLPFSAESDDGIFLEKIVSAGAIVTRTLSKQIDSINRKCHVSSYKSVTLSEQYEDL